MAGDSGQNDRHTSNVSLGLPPHRDPAYWQTDRVVEEVGEGGQGGGPEGGERAVGGLLVGGEVVLILQAGQGGLQADEALHGLQGGGGTVAILLLVVGYLALLSTAHQYTSTRSSIP